MFPREVRQRLKAAVAAFLILVAASASAATPGRDMVASARRTPVNRTSAHIGAREDAVVNLDNLVAIKTFMLRSGKTRTYSNMYNRNPWLETEHFDLYLNPDPGGPHNHRQWNMNCDPERGDFHTLVVRRKLTDRTTDDEFRDQYRRLDFSRADRIEQTLDVSLPPRPWDVPKEAIKEALRTIEGPS
jgi:hypothetical protein